MLSSAILRVRAIWRMNTSGLASMSRQSRYFMKITSFCFSL